MKKFIFTSSVIAILFLVPATMIAYLHNGSGSDSSEKSEIAKDVPSHDNGNILRLVRTF